MAARMAGGNLYNKAALDRTAAVTKISTARVAAVEDEIVRQKWNFEPFLDEIQVSTLIVAGRHDEASGTLEPACQMLQKIANSELIVMNESGHFPFAEQPLYFQHVLADFTERHLSHA
jgi:pimeloyl-ACP methyl ester carboxylesterase